VEKHHDFKNAATLYYFFYLWGETVSRGLPSYSLETTDEFLNEATINYRGLRDSRAWGCLFGNEHKKIRDMLGFDFNPYDYRFREVLTNFIKDDLRNSWIYQSVMGALVSDWKNFYFKEGGEDFAKFLMEIKPKTVFTYNNQTTVY